MEMPLLTLPGASIQFTSEISFIQHLLCLFFFFFLGGVGSSNSVFCYFFDGEKQIEQMYKKERRAKNIENRHEQTGWQG